jgi:hypothetical protein
MKKALFSVLALLLILGLSFAGFAGLALAQEDDPVVCLDSTGPGRQLNLNPYGVTWAELFYLEVDGEVYEGWCIEPDVDMVDIGECFNATLLYMPRTTPWCEIGYIMTNYSPSTDNESAAMQLAIWKCIEGRLAVTCTDPSNIETRALQIYDDAQGKCLAEPQWVVKIDPDEEDIQETVILLTKPPVGGDARPVNKLAVLAPWIGLAVLLIAGGMVWLRLRRRSA